MEDRLKELEKRVTTLEKIVAEATTTIKEMDNLIDLVKGMGKIDR